MRILFHKDDILKKMGGSTISVMQLLEVMVGLGHEAAAIAPKAEIKNSFNIPVFQEKQASRIREFYSWADLIFVKQRSPLQHIKEYQRWHVPHKADPIYTVYFASNVGQPYRYGYQEGDVDMVVFNTDWIKHETEWKGELFVLHPPIFIEKYLVDKTGDYITQINLTPQKGGMLFWEIAAALPHHKFLAVIGKEKNQVIPDSPPSNVEIYEYTDDIREIYKRTRILLMPSQGYGKQLVWSHDNLWTESYGRVGVEAALSGIPVIAYPTPGIIEALGDLGIYCEMDVSKWVFEISRLSSSDQYFTASKKVQNIRERISPLEDIKELEKLLLKKLSERSALYKTNQYKTYFEIPDIKRVNKLPKRRKKNLCVDVVVIMDIRHRGFLPLFKKQPNVQLQNENGARAYEQILKTVSTKYNMGLNIFVISGHLCNLIRDAEVKKDLPAKLKCTYNPFYNEYGLITSLWLGLLQTKNDCVVILSSDSLINEFAIKNVNKWMRIRSDKEEPLIGICIAKAKKTNTMIGEMFLNKSGNFVEIGKNIYPSSLTQKSLGIVCVRDSSSKNAFIEVIGGLLKNKKAFKKSYHWLNLLNFAKDKMFVDIIKVRSNSYCKVDNLQDLSFINEE